MPSNLPANRLHIRRKPATSHYPRMKITIRTLRLTERHLNVNPQLLHHPKTLAHPYPNTGISNPSIGGILRRDFLGKEAHILYPRLADFASYLFDIDVLCSRIGTNINLAIRAISYPLSNLIRQF